MRSGAEVRTCEVTSRSLIPLPSTLLSVISCVRVSLRYRDVVGAAFAGSRQEQVQYYG